MSVMAHHLGAAFTRVAIEQADRIALHLEDEPPLRFRELDARSNRLARHLQTIGVRRGDVIALAHDKTAAAYVAMLACLKLGAIQVTLDPGNPPERLARILATAQPRLLLMGRLEEPFAIDSLPTLLLEGEGAAPWHQACDDALPPSGELTGADPAYLMFTSGSTGHPKGAVIPHGAVLRFTSWITDRFQVSNQDIFTGLNPPYFDNSVFDFYGGLFTGASLAPVKRETMRDARSMIRRVEDAGCTLWFSVPSLLVYANAMKALAATALPAMRRLVFGGEGFPKGELARLMERFGQRMDFVNVYGPTECTCICSAHTVCADDLSSPQPLAPLGRLNPDFTGLVLDETLRPVATDVAGELWLGGPNVGLGYYDDAERTAASFVQNPLQSRYPERYYRTGDLVRRDRDGLLWFAGRVDNQIKHMGYRIELEEIDAALCRLPYVAQAGAVYRRVKEEYGQIEAFIATNEPADEARVRDDLRAMLPPYMLPRRVVVMVELPKNANGKVDRRVLQSL